MVYVSGINPLIQPALHQQSNCRWGNVWNYLITINQGFTADLRTVVDHVHSFMASLPSPNDCLQQDNEPSDKEKAGSNWFHEHGTYLYLNGSHHSWNLNPVKTLGKWQNEQLKYPASILQSQISVSKSWLFSTCRSLRASWMTEVGKIRLLCAQLQHTRPIQCPCPHNCRQCDDLPISLTLYSTLSH